MSISRAAVRSAPALFLLALVLLAREAALLGRAARLGFPAALGRHERGAHERGEALARELQVPRLRARLVTREQEATLGVELAARERCESGAHGCREHAAVREREAELHLGRDLVDVLTAGPARAHRLPFELGARQHERLVDGQVGHASRAVVA